MRSIFYEHNPALGIRFTCAKHEPTTASHCLWLSLGSLTPTGSKLQMSLVRV